jgi:hypothetical protein
MKNKVRLGEVIRAKNDDHASINLTVIADGVIIWQPPKKCKPVREEEKMTNSHP